MKRALCLANELSDLQWKVSIIAFDCLDNREHVAYWCDDRTSVYYYKTQNPVLELLKKSILVLKLKPDFIYFCSYTFRNQLFRFLIPKKSRLIIEHSELLSSNKYISRLKRFISKYFEKRSVHLADKILCASKYLHMHYQELSSVQLSKPQVAYFPYAYSERLVSDSPTIFMELQQSFSNQFNIVFVGTLTREYGLFTMLEAMHRIKKTETRVMLHLLGGGQDLEAARDFIQKYQLQDYVHLPGYVPESYLSSWFTLADAFIVPLNDTVKDRARCPSKTYMYLPFKKPVISSRIGESALLIQDENFFFSPGDPVDLSNTILNVMRMETFTATDPAQHSWKVRARELSEILEEFH